MTTDLIIDTNATVRCIYHEALSLQLIGTLRIKRVSHVEPGDDGRWTANLGPVSGPILGPFDTRTEAIQAETDWLRDHWLK